MRIALPVVLAAFTLTATTALGAAEPNPKVAIETTKGKIVVELFADKAPISTQNFLAYVDAKFYNGTIFHRAIPGFMIQGGGFTKDLSEKPTRPPIKNEAANGIANTRGTLAMARTNVVDSATAQFFINVANNAFLDHKSPEQFGYAVFGKVIEGMGVVDGMVGGERLCPSTAKAPCTANLPPGMQDVPVEPIIIVKAYRVK